MLLVEACPVKALHLASLLNMWEVADNNASFPGTMAEATESTATQAFQ